MTCSKTRATNIYKRRHEIAKDIIQTVKQIKALRKKLDKLDEEQQIVQNINGFYNDYPIFVERKNTCYGVGFDIDSPCTERRAEIYPNAHKKGLWGLIFYLNFSYDNRLLQGTKFVDITACLEVAKRFVATGKIKHNLKEGKE